MDDRKRAFVIVIDGLGCGALPDADRYGDAGTNTLVNAARAVGGICVPNLHRLGLGNIIEIQGCPPADNPAASFGKMAERAAAKDTMTGYWEMMGLDVKEPARTFSSGFPLEFIKEFERRCGRDVIGNIPASGTEIIKELGGRHLETGELIVYTSADSVFQVAAHEGVVPLDELYRYCEIAREILTGDWTVGRVIARPFVGKPVSFQRTTDRKDFALEPPGRTIVDIVADAGMDVVSIGKVRDILGGRGFTGAEHTESDQDGLAKTCEVCRKRFTGLVLVNLVDLDTLFGHRNNPTGYAKALSDLDKHLGLTLGEFTSGDMVIICADHGCDPTHESTDHTREYVPLLVFGDGLKTGVPLGIRGTLADVGATVSEYFDLEATESGTSFLSDVC